MEKTTLYLPEELRRALREAAKRERRSQAEVMREALEAYVAKRPRELPRSIGVGEDGSVGARESKAWIRERWRERD